MIYLFFGPNDFARTVAINALRASIPTDVVDLNSTLLDGRTTRLPELRTACLAYPMLHDRRLVVINGAIKQARSAEARDGLRQLVTSVPHSTDLVLNEDDPPDQRLALIKDLVKAEKAGTAEIREFKLLEGAALNAWVSEQARLVGVAFRPDAIQSLVDLAGNEPWALHNEVAKLAAFAGFSGTLTVVDVQRLVSDETETNMFGFLDALCGRRGHVALQSLHGLLADGAAPLYILTMIARQVRLMVLVSGFGRQSPNDVAQAIGQKPFVVKKALEQARLYSASELRDFHHEVLSADHAIKTGRTIPEAALELLVGVFGYPQRMPNLK
jgi:DNA polymerase-3 subunit delta